VSTRVRRGPTSTTASGPAGDPVRAAEIIVRVAHRTDVPSHLLLGVNAVDLALDYSRRQLAEATTWERVGRSADFDESYPTDLPPDPAD
jgi:hypothetical protein